MLVGRFGNTSGRPYIEGRIHLPRLGIQGELSFLVDTGADRSYLMPGDAAVLGIDYSRLEPGDVSVGIGGTVRPFEERAVLVFSDDAKVYAYAIQLTIAPHDEEMMAVPSLLGRDVIDRWLMVYSPSDTTLHFDVRSADLTEDVPPS